MPLWAIKAFDDDFDGGNLAEDHMDIAWRIPYCFNAMSTHSNEAVSDLDKGHNACANRNRVGHLRFEERETCPKWNGLIQIGGSIFVGVDARHSPSNLVRG